MRTNRVVDQHLLRGVYWAVDLAVCGVVHDRAHSPIHQTVQKVAYMTSCRTMYRTMNMAVYDDPPHPALANFLAISGPKPERSTT